MFKVWVDGEEYDEKEFDTLKKAWGAALDRSDLWEEPVYLQLPDNQIVTFRDGEASMNVGFADVEKLVGVQS